MLKVQTEENATVSNMAVGYIRCSNMNPKEATVQRMAISAFAERKGLSLDKFYTDIAKSGKSAKREAFQEMLADAQKKKFKCLIVHEWNRFSRDRYDSVIYKKILKMNGVTILSVIENLDGSPESKILEGVLEGAVEKAVEYLSEIFVEKVN